MSRAHGSCNTTSKTLASIAVEVIVSLNFMLSQRISHASGYQCPDSNISHWGGSSGSGGVITEDLVNISKRHAFWSLKEDILKINDSDNQYSVSIKEDTAYPCLHSPKTTKETSSIRRIQRRSIRRIQDI
ncbi:hypothetical protein Tco_0033046 [Tanacetum coccineum]